MNARVVVAGLLAGLTVFVWSAISHMALPLGEVGISPLPVPGELLPAIRERVPESGFYAFPWDEDAAKRAAALRTEPRGILVVTPASQPFSFGGALATEAATNIAGGLLAAFLFAGLGTSLVGIGQRLAFGAALGAFASLAIDFSYWTWDGFPTEYLAAQLVDHIVGWSLAALVIGWRLGKR